MGSNEDYLDSLLNSVIEQDVQNNSTYQPASVFSAGLDDENESDIPDHSDMDEINRLLEKATLNTAEDLQTEDDIRKMFAEEKDGKTEAAMPGAGMADELENLHMPDEPVNAKEIEEILEQDPFSMTQEEPAPKESEAKAQSGQGESADISGDIGQEELAALLGESVEEMPDNAEEGAQEEAADASGDFGQDELAALLGDNVEEEMPDNAEEGAQEEAAGASGDFGQDELAALLGENTEELPDDSQESAGAPGEIGQDEMDASGDFGQDELAALLGDNVEEEMPNEDQAQDGQTGMSDLMSVSANEDGDDLQALLQGQDADADLLGGAGGGDDMDALLRGLMSGEEPVDTDAQQDAGADDILSPDHLQSEEDTISSGASDLDDEINALLGMAGGAQESADQPDFDMANIFAETEQQSGQSINDGSEDPIPEKPAKKRKKEKKKKEAPEEAGSLDDTSGKKKKKRGEKVPKKAKLPKPESEEFEEGEEKKNGFFAKMGRALFGDDEDEDIEAEEMNVSDAALTEDGEKPKGGKKKKPAKGKKPKKGDKKNTDEAEDDEESSGKSKKGKPEKKKKEKKEKKPKAEENIPGWTTPRGKIFSVFAFCFTILAILVILANILPAQNDLKKARKAYYEQDYRTAFQNLNGKKLNDSDYILYVRCVMVLNLQNRVDHYTVFMDMDKEKIALNELMMAVQYYQDNLALAEAYGAVEEINAVYSKVLSLLQEHYHLSEAEAVRINSLDDLEYNKSIYYLLNGKEFTLPQGFSKAGSADTDQTE